MRTSRRWWLVFFLGPAIVLFAAFITYPILSALAFSLYAWEGIGRRGFVGLANFARLFATFPYAGLLVNAFWHNVLVFIATMLLQNVTALGLAVLLARGPWGARGYRVIFFLPVMLSLVIVGFLCALFLNPVFGLVNKVLTLLHAGALARFPDHRLPGRHQRRAGGICRGCAHRRRGGVGRLAPHHLPAPGAGGDHHRAADVHRRVQLVRAPLHHAGRVGSADPRHRRAQPALLSHGIRRSGYRTAGHRHRFGHRRADVCAAARDVRGGRRAAAPARGGTGVTRGGAGRTAVQCVLLLNAFLVLAPMAIMGV